MTLGTGQGARSRPHPSWFPSLPVGLCPTGSTSLAVPIPPAPSLQVLHIPLLLAESDQGCSPDSLQSTKAGKLGSTKPAPPTPPLCPPCARAPRYLRAPHAAPGTGSARAPAAPRARAARAAWRAGQNPTAARAPPVDDVTPSAAAALGPGRVRYWACAQRPAQ